MFVWFKSIRDTVSFVRNPERFIANRTKQSPTFHFWLAGRKVLATGDPNLASRLFDKNTNGLFFQEPLHEVLGPHGVLMVNGDRHARLRTLLRSSLANTPLQPIADFEAHLFKTEVLEPLRRPFRVDLMPHVRRYVMRATLQMLFGGVDQAVLDGFLEKWNAWMKALHPLLMLPPHPAVRFSCWGWSPWDRCEAAREEVRAELDRMSFLSHKGTASRRMRMELEVDELVDQFLVILFGSYDNPAILLARMLQEMETPNDSIDELMDRALEKYPPVPFCPHEVLQDRPELGLRAGDGLAFLPTILKDKSGWGLGPHRCLGVQWAQILVKTAMRTLRPHLQGTFLEVGPPIRQRFSWGPGSIELRC